MSQRPDGFHALLPVVSYQGIPQVEGPRITAQMRALWLGRAQRLLEFLPLVRQEAAAVMRRS
jgi:hypothetical protein